MILKREKPGQRFKNAKIITNDFKKHKKTTNDF